MSILLTGITFITTYNCNANCNHCFFETQGKKKYMSPEVIDIVYKDSSITKKMFWNHFSGGEILLEKNILLEIIKRTRKYFDGDIGISTNGFWAKDKTAAKQTVSQLIQAGVDGIAVSTDYYHTPFISKEYIKNAVEVITESGIKTHSYIMGARCNNDVHNAKIVNKKSIEHALYAQAKTNMPLAPTIIRSIGKGSIINTPKKKEIPQGGCTDLSECLGQRGPLNPAMVWVDPYGNVMVCYGIIIGNIYNTPFIKIINSYSEKAFPLLQTIANKNPKELHQLALKKGVTTKDSFYDVCDICFQSRKALRKLYPEILGPEECYP